MHDEKSTLLAKSNIIIDTNKDHQLNDTIRKGISKANKSIEFITIDQLDIATKDLGFFDSKQAIVTITLSSNFEERVFLFMFL